MDALTNVLTYHVIGTNATTANLPRARITTLNGEKVQLSTSPWGVTMNGAAVVVPDVLASNGVVHVIDAVLLPYSYVPPACSGQRSLAAPAPRRLDDDGGACGASWIEATTSCAVRCSSDGECPAGQTCQLAARCGRPLDPIQSKQIMIMLGDFPGSETMGPDDEEVFHGVILDRLEPKFATRGVSITGVKVTGQSPSKSRRDLRRRRALSENVLDVFVDVSGMYRPPPCLDMDTLIEDSINEASQQLVEDLRERSAFFAELENLAAVRESAATPRPTPAPTRRTRRPTPRPTRVSVCFRGRGRARNTIDSDMLCLVSPPVAAKTVRPLGEIRQERQERPSRSPLLLQVERSQTRPRLLQVERGQERQRSQTTQEGERERQEQQTPARHPSRRAL